MAAAKELKESQENESPKTKWQKLKKGGIIGAAALTGGALLAITGGRSFPVPLFYTNIMVQYWFILAVDLTGPRIQNFEYRSPT